MSLIYCKDTPTTPQMLKFYLKDIKRIENTLSMLCAQSISIAI